MSIAVLNIQRTTFARSRILSPSLIPVADRGANLVDRVARDPAGMGKQSKRVVTSLWDLPKFGRTILAGCESRARADFPIVGSFRLGTGKVALGWGSQLWRSAVLRIDNIARALRGGHTVKWTCFQRKVGLRSHKVSSSKRCIPSLLAEVQPFSHMNPMIVLLIVLPTVVAIAYCIYLLKAVEREH